MKKISILGLVLLAASAVTYAVIPKAAKSLKLKGGVCNLKAGTQNPTCIPTPLGDSCVSTDPNTSHNPTTAVDCIS